jgi:hypothetical protein
MPRRQEPKKDVANDDTPRGAVSRLRSGDFRMGEPTCCHRHVPYSEYIAVRRQTRGTETSKYPEEEKTIVIPSVAASERGLAQTYGFIRRGCGTSHMELQRCSLGEEIWKGLPQRVKVL